MTRLVRWTASSLVGALRMAVQLSAYFLLTPPLSGLALPATALAGELTVLQHHLRQGRAPPPPGSGGGG